MAAVWNQLLAGNSDYVNGIGRPTVTEQTPAARQHLSDNGQAPIAIIVTCADSRCPPELIFQETIGRLFVVRCAGNVLSDFSALGSVEFGVAALKASLVVVMGHSKCGAVNGAMAAVDDAGASLPELGATAGLRDLLVHIGKTCKVVKAASPNLTQPELVKKAIAFNAVKSADDIRASPVIDAAIKAGDVKVVSAVYDLATGVVTQV